LITTGLEAEVSYGKWGKLVCAGVPVIKDLNFMEAVSGMPEPGKAEGKQVGFIKKELFHGKVPVMD
jgi:hypothetical protein